MIFWLDELEKVNRDARLWLNEVPIESWCRANFQTRPKCDMLLNNLCECFNRYILDVRDRGIIDMLEMIKVKLMRRLGRKRRICERIIAKGRERICPKILKKLEKLKDESIFYVVEYSGGPSVSCHGHGKTYVVNMMDLCCDCGKWRLTGIPCEHAVAAIMGNDGDPVDYINECYYISTYMNVYSHYINPTEREELWPKPTEDVQPVKPPAQVQKRRGRKVTARRKEPEEIAIAAAQKKMSKKATVRMTCQICHVEGHNKRRHTQGQNKRKKGPSEGVQVDENSTCGETPLEQV
ncbi:hypothetical protein Scep_029384 [Stephania cephalantha]|uniref:SWIM-type domain-containing protein n=1 Tax=Stephania cephalantha TaxID=152367 RepID=A0AAP0E5A1_9MAGN